MELSEFKSRAASKGALIRILFELTYRCDLDCFMCYNDRGRSGELMRLADYEKIFAQFRRHGVIEVILSGGEPLLHPDFYAIGSALRRLRVITKIKTNGTYLTRRNIERLANEVDPYVIQISIHGHNASLHDKQTGVDGSFARLVENIQAAKSAGLQLLLSGIITAWNDDAVKEMYALSERLGVPMGLGIGTVSRTNGDETPLGIDLSKPSRKTVAKLYKEQMLKKSATFQKRHENKPASKETNTRATNGYFCSAGVNSIAIDPFGNVSPCVIWARKLGNVREAELEAILANDAMELVKSRLLGDTVAGTCPAERGELC